MHSREVVEYAHAKQRAARQVLGGGRKASAGWIRPSDLPSNAEIREQVRVLSRLHDKPDEGATLLAMRVRAMWWLRQLAGLHGRLIGSVLAGAIREGSDIDLHVYTNHVSVVTDIVEQLGFGFTTECKRIEKDGQLRVFNHIHVADEFSIEITVYATGMLGHRFRSSIDGKPIAYATADQLEALIEMEHYIGVSKINEQLDQIDGQPDRRTLFLGLLLPLENVRQNPIYHPEGDALFHSLQVYDLASHVAAYDEEFLLAALLHDVGKAIDPGDHVAAGVEAVDGWVTPRTRWLIENHMEAHAIADRTIGRRRLRRLAEHPWYRDLITLGDCDRSGRVPGASTSSVDEALDDIEMIAERFGS